LDSKAVVVLTVNRPGDHQVVLKDFESLPGDHVNRENRITQFTPLEVFVLEFD
jgi:hypothetical protein